MTKPLDESWGLVGVTPETARFFSEKGFRPSQVDRLRKTGELARIERGLRESDMGERKPTVEMEWSEVEARDLEWSEVEQDAQAISLYRKLGLTPEDVYRFGEKAQAAKK